MPGRVETDSTAGVAGRDRLSGAASPGSHGKGCTMADSVIFIGWTKAVRGREETSQKVFREAMEHWGRLQASGEIEGFDVVLLDAHGGDLGGFFLLKGEREKVARVRASEEMEQLMVRANVIVEGLGAVGGVTGEGVMRRMAAFLEASRSLG